MLFLDAAPRYLFFTGKGGVGKTSLSCASAIALADAGQRVLLVSTDPASNLDEVLGVALSPTPIPVPGVERLQAMNIDPEAAAKAYRERVVGPVRGLLPDSAIASIEEHLSGACTVEIAAFDEFAKLLGEPNAAEGFDHVILDTAPTGHTLRLLELPEAWSDFFQANAGGTSCLGPLSGLKAQRTLYESTRAALADGARTRVVMVSRPERSALTEAARAAGELRTLGVSNQHLVINGLFVASDRADGIALELERRGAAALEELPESLRTLPRTEVPLLPHELVGLASLRVMWRGGLEISTGTASAPTEALPPPLSRIVEELAAQGHGVVMTMGKGGVGKTTVASAIAIELARRGHPVRLTTTDPAAHLAMTIGAPLPGITLGRIDPQEETRLYRAEVMQTAGVGLDAKGRALLAEDLASPCTEEVAVFRAFAREVEAGEAGFVVVDTAPTGHTILLFDAAEAYHREVLRQGSTMPDSVRKLLPRLRDPAFTRIILVTLPEATPVHEARALQSDLARAGITPFAWVVNQSFLPVVTRDPVLRCRQRLEEPYLREVESLVSRCALLRWVAFPPVGRELLGRLLADPSPSSAASPEARA
jgi:arsenite-transporting ATPase